MKCSDCFAKLTSSAVRSPKVVFTYAVSGAGPVCILPKTSPMWTFIAVGLAGLVLPCITAQYLFRNSNTANGGFENEHPITSHLEHFFVPTSAANVPGEQSLQVAEDSWAKDPGLHRLHTVLFLSGYIPAPQERQP